LWLYDHPDVSDLFNVGTGKARSFKDLALAVFAAMGKEPDIKFVPTPEAIRDKYQYFTEADMSKLRARGYDAPMTPLEEGVRQYVQGFLATEDPFR
jgi:ADP-L-glycero-D-manno-heptose 6-epimerase